MTVEDSAVSAKSFLEAAKSYGAALELLVSHLDRKLIYPVGLMASQALELALKAVLIKDGCTELELRNEINHDLRKVLCAAEKRGLKINWTHNSLLISSL